MITNTEAFDEAIKNINEVRGVAYGHPFDNFKRTEKLKLPLRACKNLEIRHALEMIAGKMARLVETPDHLDSIIDIAGYARAMTMVLDEQNRRSGINERAISSGGQPNEEKKNLLAGARRNAI